MKRFKIILISIFVINVRSLSISLDGIWTGLINICDQYSYEKCGQVTFPAVVPGGIYTDLSAVGLISNNLIGKNDVKNRWVGNQSVIYTKTFSVNDAFLSASNVFLIFHGLDTYATISINNQIIGETSNMFLRYTFEIKQHLRLGDNNLKVLFYSAVKVAEKLYNEQSLQYIVPPKCVPKEYNGECHVNHIRKMQSSFSWDWGPAFPSMGIWKNVELISENTVLVTDVTVDISKKVNIWELIVTVFFEVPNTERNKNILCDLSTTLYISNLSTVYNSSKITLHESSRYTNASIILLVPVNLVHKWWPNGYGKQNLYKLKTVILTPSKKIYKNTRIGFRTVELVQEPLKKGLSFYFRVNNIPIFAKGSNFIPANVLPELAASKDTIQHLLQSAKETHMNMLRVWGGGMYESDLFYDLADEYGIMIWQDFMFACAMYPTTKSFLNSVKNEILQNVRRLKNHPSIVLWAGNNENEAALYGNWYGTGSDNVYRDDYVKLYVHLIKTEVERLDPIRPFVVSSPSNGVYTEKYNFTGENPYSNIYGDVHYYNYLRNGWDINQYPHTRFSSEYGFQSIPSIYTLSTAVEFVADLRVNSDFIKHRQHLPFGMEFMELLISKNFVIPQSDDTIRDFIDFIYLSQINQAVSVKIQTELYRQLKSELNTIGEGFTMGALYWQLNDVWQAPSWSSIEYSGKWKMLHYYAKDFFAPIIVTSRLSEANELSLYVVSDKLLTMMNCIVKVKIYNWNSMVPQYTINFEDVTVESNKAKMIASVWLDDILRRANCGSLITAKKYCIIMLTLENNNGIQHAPVNYVYPTILRDTNFLLANISVKVNNLHLPGKFRNYPDFEIELITNNIALFVWIETKSIHGHFSENGFHMFEKIKYLTFHAYEPTTSKLLEENLKITTLSDIYNPDRIFDMDYLSDYILGGGK